MSDSFHRIRSYVIRAARISNAQKKAYDAHSPSWVLPVNRRALDSTKLFPEAEKIIVEIGFGMGNATRQMAKEHPEWGIVGIEVHKPGVGKLLWWINQDSLKNLFIIEHDAVEVFSEFLPKSSIDGIHIWFPDPWPKKRHYKRRLIQADFTGKLLKVLKSGGYIHAATDWEPYANHILDVFNKTPGLKNRYALWADKPDYRPDTKFEKRGIEARRIIRDIIFEKE